MWKDVFIPAADARWATYCALAEEHGRSWREWPAELRHPRAAAVQQAARGLADRVLISDPNDPLPPFTGVGLKAFDRLGLPAGKKAFTWEMAEVGGVDQFA